MIPPPQLNAVEEESKTKSFAERDLSDQAKASYQKLLTKLAQTKNDSNCFGQAFRLFQVSPVAQQGFPSISSIRHNYGRGIAALYIFKLQHAQADSCTHGLHIRLQGFVHRRVFEQLIRDIIKSFAVDVAKIKSASPSIKNTISLFDYLQTLYVSPQNLLVNFSHQHDAVASAMKVNKVDTHKTSVLKNKMSNLTCQIIDTMIAMPAKYPQSYLSSLLAMPQAQFRRHMRSTDINEIVTHVGQDAYNIALQDKTFKQQEAQELMEPMTRRAMLNRCMTDRITKHIHLLIQQTFDSPFVHPHPFNGLFKSEHSQLKPLDGLLFDPRFMFSVMLTARWFARTCMRADDATSSNHAHLALYGSAGTGKTLLTSSIASCVPTYRYLTTARFQNPDMLQSSILQIEECDTDTLLTNHYKALLDLKCHVKIDFKNLNPENVTEGVPCMITTNDDVISKLRGNKRSNVKASVDAALRRLYLVPMKIGAFEQLHGRPSKLSQYYSDVAPFESMYDKEPCKLQRIFNLILAVALYQQDIQNMYTDQRLYAYFKKISQDFANTAFGTFYLQNKKDVDRCITEVEEMMMGLECDDASYQARVYGSTGQFQQLIYQFLEGLLQRTQKLKTGILRDSSVPWTLKSYYFLSDYDFAVSLMWENVKDSQAYLNAEIRQFIYSVHAQPFTVAVSNPSDLGICDMMMDVGSIQSSLQDFFCKDEDVPNPNEDSLLGKRPASSCLEEFDYGFKRQYM